jgi:hypothetical protein
MAAAPIPHSNKLLPRDVPRAAKVLPGLLPHWLLPPAGPGGGVHHAYATAAPHGCTGAQVCVWVWVG